MSDTPFPPPGFVDREEAARRFGVAARTWADWERAGKVDCGKWFKLPWGGRRMLYPLEAVERMVRELKHAPFPPPGMVDRREAARMFGVSSRTWSTWELEGRITCGRLVSTPGKTG